MKHKHAELMMQYAQDAMGADKPWELWEYSHASSNGWRNLDKMPSWRIGNDYRRKPKMVSVTLMDGEVLSWPEPHRAELKYRDAYYCVNADGTVAAERWDCLEWESDTLSNGYIHLTEEAVRQHAVALHKINNQVAK